MKGKINRKQYHPLPSVFMMFMLLLTIFPLIYMVSMSLRTPNNVFSPSLFVKDVTMRNYYLVISQNPNLFHNFFISLTVAVISMLLVMISGSMAVYALSRKNVAGKRFLYNLIMCTLMVPVAGLVVPITQINAGLGWINQPLGLIFPYAALGVPYAVTILQSFMNGIPHELEEAAVVDGCGFVRLYLQLYLPLLKPGIVVVMIWQFLQSWNEFFLALCTMTQGTMKTLPLIAQQYNGSYFSQPSALFAALTIVTVPTLIFYCCVQKQFVRGMTAGAVKG